VWKINGGNGFHNSGYREAFLFAKIFVLSHYVKFSIVRFHFLSADYFTVSKRVTMDRNCLIKKIIFFTNLNVAS
jgi:hypothetical protein